MTQPHKDPNDIVLISATRTAFTKAHRGSFANTHPDILLTQLIQKTLARVGLDPNEISDVILGNVLIPQGGVIEARSACLKAGIPVEVPVMTINRQCTSGLEVLRLVSRNGITLVGGFECMSKFGLNNDFYVSDDVRELRSWDIESEQRLLQETDNENTFMTGLNSNDVLNDQKIIGETDKENISIKNISSINHPKAINNVNASSYNIPRVNHQHAQDCLLPMGITSERITRLYDLKRDEIDQYAYESHKRSFDAQKKGSFENEIIPICINEKDEVKFISIDDGIREPNFEKLKQLKPVFETNGCSTAGNSSQLSDGASLLILTTRKKAIELNLKILMVFKDIVSVGVEPSIMGIGPIPAITKLLKRNNLKINDINIFEVNEAFASQALICMQELKIERNKYNINGGALGIGHPVGASGGRLICSLTNLMHDLNSGYCVASMCAGTGMGTAVLFYKEGS